MSYKVKSALYFVCFLAAVTIYYSIEHNIKIDSIAEKVGYTGVNVENNATNLLALKAQD
ncbi:MAG: hypothetical protein KJN76_00485 [Eudoraea sp.]|nr:hypothetical protein [Eudoraea sp.]